MQESSSSYSPQSCSSPFSVLEDGKHLVAWFYRRLLHQCMTFPAASVHDRERLGQLGMLAIALALVSCNNDKIEVYRIPKEAIKVSMQRGSEELVPPPGNPAQWTRPDGWKEQPLSEMRLGSFKVDGSNAASADISVIAFPGEAGGLISNINRWRGQLQLAPLEEDQLAQTTQRTEVDNVPTYLVDFQTTENAAKPSRILGAVFQAANRT